MRDCGASADGHAQACGVTFESEEALKRALESITYYLKEVTPTNKEYVEPNYPTLDKDVDVSLVCDFINNGEPYGKGFEKPKIRMVVNESDIYEMRCLGKNHEHLKITLNNGLVFMAWNTKSLGNIVGKQIEVVGDPGLNEWMGNVTPQIIGTLKVLD